jgi:hypothetical protein
VDYANLTAALEEFREPDMRFLQIIEERTDENALESFSGPGRQSGGFSPWADDSIAMPLFFRIACRVTILSL